MFSFFKKYFRNSIFLNKNANTKGKNGFTIIELIMVIAVLGILAAFALPRFPDLTLKARLAALHGLQGAVRSASALAHTQQLADGVASSIPIVLEGVTINMIEGYPVDVAGGIDLALQDYSGFTFVDSFGFVMEIGRAHV